MNLLAQWHLEQDRLERRRWLQSSLTVALVIVAVLAVVHWHSGTTPVLPAPALPMVVELAPSPQSPEDSSAEPPGPRQQEAPLPQPTPPEPQVPELPEPAALPPADIALPEIRPPAPELPPQQLLPAPMTTTPQGENAPRSAQAAAPQQSARSLLTEAMQLSFRDRLLGHLQRYKRYPRAAQARGRQGVPYIRFTMNREGQVLMSSLERGSGHESLDQEALALIARAQPLPAFPEELGGSTLEIVVPIEFLLRR